MPRTPSFAWASSPARPWISLAAAAHFARAAPVRDVPGAAHWAIRPTARPVSTSPLPPLAMPAHPLALSQGTPSTGMTVVAPFNSA